MDETVDPTPAIAPSPPAEGFVIADRYHVRRRLGRGASKEVYLAYDERLDREVAVALVVGAAPGSTARARLEREARVTGRLGDHPNVITVHDTGDVEGVPCLVMRVMAGGSLAEALERGGIPLADAVRVGRDIAVALAHAHAHGVIHRDVKPANVWLDEHGGGALGDFGIAHEEGADRLTTEGALLGTVRYMSPEQIRGAQVGAASDLYSLGVTLYELLTGRPPFTATEPRHVLTQHLNEPPPPPSLGVPELERLVLELLEKDPLHRPPSAAGVAERLGAIRIGDGVPPRVDLPAPDGEPPRRVSDTPFIDRVDYLEALEATFARTAAERVCRMVTVTGQAGIGKSRLAAEFAGRLGASATVLTGRCRPAGEGTTYQALATLLGEDPRARIDELLGDDEPAAHALLGALGLTAEPVPVEDIAWALRRMLERVALQRPLLVAVEDVHWAEPPLLEALDHVAALSTGSPILVLCLARPEFLEVRPQWATPQRNRAVHVLDALGDEDSRTLAQRLGAGDRTDRIAERAEGNPLFLEQLIAVDVDADDELPASLQAVLQARISRLQAGERALLQRASIEGRTFHAGALGACGGLVGLVRKGLIEPDRPTYAGEEAFRFTHALIREAAYADVPKPRRAELHAAVADWLAGRDAADAVVGHHLERASLLGHPEAGLAERAAERLRAAAQTSLARADPTAGVGLLQRAVALVEGDARLRLLPALGAALFEAGAMADATVVLEEAIERAPDAGVRARAQVEREFVRLETETSAPTHRAERVGRAALDALTGDEAGACRAWSLRAQAAWNAGQVERADGAWIEAERRASDERQRFAILGWRATAAVLGPAPVDEAIARCETFRAQLAVSPVAIAWALNPLASLHAMRGEFGLAEQLLREANETLATLGSLNASVNHHEALVWSFADRPERVEAALRPAVAALEELGGGALLATTSALLAQALYAMRRFDEAREACVVAADGAAADDILTEVVWRGVQAKLLARAGAGDRALLLAREAVALAEPTDLLVHKADGMLDLGEVLRLCSRPTDARAAIEHGLALHARKGNVARSRNHVWEE